MGKANSQNAPLSALALPESKRARIVSWLAAFAVLVLVLVAPAANAQTIIYVNDDAPAGGNGTSWATAFRDLHDAFDAAEAIPFATRNVEVWMTSGVYKPTRRKDASDPRSARFVLPAKVRLVGQFVGTETSRSQILRSTPPTVFSGDLAGDDVPNSTAQNRSDNIYQFFDLALNATTQVFQFLHFTGGHATGNATNAPWSRNGTLFDSGLTTAEAVFEDCVFLQNVANYGGVWHGQPATFRRCRFLGNRAAQDGGVGYVDKSNPETVFVNCEFHANVCEGVSVVEERAGLLLTLGASRFVQCTIVGNVTTGDASAVTLYRGRVSTVELSGCIVTLNTSPSAAVFASGGSGGALAVTGANNVIQGQAAGRNTTLSLTNTLGASATIVNRLGPDGIAGTLDDNLELTSSSPFIDAITVTPAAEVLPADVLGRICVFDRLGLGGAPRIDPGAHESGSPPWSPRLYVRESAPANGIGANWSTAFSGRLGLQSALARAALPGSGVEEIWVAAGTYTPSPSLPQGGSRSVSFNLQNNLAIYGGFQGNETSLSQRNITASPTVLSGDINQDDEDGPNFRENSLQVVRAVGVSNAVLSGFKVSGGNNRESNVVLYGAGMFIDSANVGVEDCQFINNSASQGGGMYVGGQHDVRVERCQFLGNSAQSGAGLFKDPQGNAVCPSVVVRECVFADNVATDAAGALYLSDARGRVSVLWTDFLRNVGGSSGAVTVQAGSGTCGPLEMSSCRFFANTSLESTPGAVGAISVGPSAESGVRVVLSNNVFVGNESFGSASALSLQAYTTVDVVNSTFVGNRGYQLGERIPGAAVHVRNGSGNCGCNPISLYNCILYANTVAFFPPSQSSQIVAELPSDVSVSHSVVNGWTGSLGGTNNNGLDPVFIRSPSPGPDQSWGTPDDDYGDLRLSSNSPAIDSGDSLAVPQDTYDIDQDGNTTEALPLDLAGQPRFYDDPTRTNTGNGNPPVDRGAYENNLATTTWADPFGGRFDDATNWAGGVPTSTVRAIFDSSIGLNRAYTVTIPTNQSAYSLSVLANELNINLRGLTTSGNLTLAGPGTDQNAPTLLVSGPAGVPTGLAVTNTGNTPRTLFAGNGVVAAAAGTAANLRVDGSRASLQFANTLDLGLAGSAQVSVVNRGWLGATSLRAGLNPGSAASITVAGTPGVGDSLLSLAGPGADEVILASRGTATLTGTNQALIAGIDALDRVVLAEHPGSVATLSLSGLGTLWDTSQNDLIFAKAGTANISITDGAQLTTATANSLILAEQPGSVANITIGPGSNWTELVQSVVLAGEGEATITMLPGSSLNFQSNLVVNPAGTIQGSGTITGGVFNVGTVRVGNSPGTLTINGSFRQLAGQSDPDPARRNRAGQLEMEVQGLAPNQYDRLIINPGVGGTAELGGGLIVRLGQGIDIADNTQLPIITGPRGATRFDAALLPSLPNNRFARVIYGSGLNSPVNLGVQPLQPPYSPDEPEGAAVAGIPSAVIAADFDNDGDPDLAVTVPDEVANQPGAVFVMRNAGVQAGNWQGFPSVDILQLNTGIDPQDIDAADMDGDGLPEFIVANKGSDNVVIYKNTAGTGFTPLAPIATGNAPVSVSAAVFFDSGTATQLPDLLVANELDETVQFYRNSDAPGPPVLLVRPAVTVPGRPVRTRPSDLDNDKRRRREAVALVAASGTAGSQDAVVPLVPSGPDGPNANFLRLPSVPVPSAPKDLISHNLNSVPTDDVIVISQSGTLSVLRNRTPVEGTIGTEPLAPAVNLPIAGVGIDLAAINIDGDSDLDVAIVTSQSLSPSSPRDVLTLRNLSDESTMIALAEPESLSATGADPLLVVGADVDTSGIEDVIYLGVPPECATCLTTPQNVFTRPAPVTTPSQCDTIDFNNDGLFPDDADLIEFLSVLSGVDCTTGTCNDIDFNNDGLFPDDADLSAFLRVLSGADCQ